MFLQAPGVSTLVASENRSHKIFFALREISIGHCLANEVWLKRSCWIGEVPTLRYAILIQNTLGVNLVYIRWPPMLAYFNFGERTLSFFAKSLVTILNY